MMTEWGRNQTRLSSWIIVRQMSFSVCIGAIARSRRCLFLLSSKGSQVTEADELVPSLIPKTKGERFEAGEQRHRLDGLKQRVGPMAPLEVVIGNPRTEMMDVM